MAYGAPHAARAALPGGLVVLAALAFGAPPCGAVVQLPPGFYAQIVETRFRDPTSLAFLPDGRALLTEQRTGKIRMVVNRHLAATDPVLVVPDVEGSEGERGLVGIAVDPRWPDSPYVYLFHTRVGEAMRLVRYQASGDLSNPDGELLTFEDPLILIDDIPDTHPSHNGGALRFGPDSCLYVAIGDDVTPCHAADSSALRGQILRLEVRGLPATGGPPPARDLLTPPDNPFVASPDSNARLVFAYGLRNPFRFHIDPEHGTVFVADVGEAEFDELDVVEPGDFLGWPWREGPLVRPREECPEPGGEGTCLSRGPLVALPHATSGWSAIVSAGPYWPVPGGEANWPPEYCALRGDLFYADFYEGFLRRLTWSGSAWEPAPPVPGQPDTVNWATGLVTPCDFQVGPDGALWWVAYSDAVAGIGTGSLHRIGYRGTTTGVETREPRHSPLSVAPNPFHATTTLRFALDTTREVRLEIFGLAGRLKRRLLDGVLPAGHQSVSWNGVDGYGRPVPPGLYLARLSCDGAVLGTTRVLRVQ